MVPGDIQRFLANRALEHSNKPATILRYREVVHAFFEHAVRLDVLDKNPVKRIPRPRLSRQDPRFLSQDQIKELLLAVKGDPIEPLVATLVYAGLRREEVCWVTWDCLELKNKPPLLRIRAKTVEGEHWMPKTKRDRTIPISKKLRTRLRKLKKGASPWVFPSPTGCRWDPDNLSRHFRALMKEAKLPWNFLELRHTFGSQLARKGISVLKISQLMGNSPQIAQRHYIHLIPEEMVQDVEF